MPFCALCVLCMRVGCVFSLFTFMCVFLRVLPVLLGSHDWVQVRPHQFGFGLHVRPLTILIPLKQCADQRFI